MTVNVTKKEVELHATINILVQSQHPDLTPAHLTWLDDVIWKYILRRDVGKELDTDSVYRRSNDYAAYILKNQSLSAIYGQPMVKHSFSLNVVFCDEENSVY